MYPSLKFVDTENSRFFSTLKGRIDDYFHTNQLSKKANTAMVAKTVVYLIAFIGLYGLIILEVFSPLITLSLAMLLGVTMACIGFNICHDALHGAYSTNSKVNKSLGFLFNIIGASEYVWRITHNKIHHTYTNIIGHDGDLEVAPGLIRLSDKDKKKSVHRFQHVYAFLLYSLTSLSWFFRKDYLKFFQKNIGAHTNKHPKREYFNLFAYKAMYYTLFIIIPLGVMDIAWWQFLIGYLLMNFVEGLVLGLVFQLAHLVEETDMPSPKINEPIEAAWAVHQMRTTANFAVDSKTATFLCGGLNFQVEHHLFPNICHIHYPAISKILRKTAAEFNIPYINNGPFLTALGSHYRFLRKHGRN
ncbi:fatty acid desaturase family protein [Echinicola vietnamensis]|uniref:Fatty acid desaturase n=1 Tax=Echinicola vietnamensis (strain DSM 17526 / LMG 23754 / KMM 6221) TaxID=926556 RepID=L0FXU5_ECHVK|nr:acyl-CoA desaturase [Echinicola vietnamensis]AGA78734.1 fatty acid desaturase [Echinicola vietnamensis DSM 17526]